MRPALLIAACSLLGLAGCQTLPSDPGSFVEAALQGVVFDGSSRGVQDFVLTLDGGAKVTSDINGKFTFEHVARGHHSLVATKPDHEAISLEFDYLNRSQILYLSTKSVRDYLGSAEIAMRQRNYALAKELADKALKLSPRNVVARYLLAMVQLSTRQYPEAWRLTQELLQEGVHETAVYLTLIELAQADPQYRPAVDSLVAQDPYISQIPELSRALERLAQTPVPPSPKE